LLAFTVSYYGINSWLISFAIAFERHLSAFKIWRDNFVWIALNYFGGASVAALLVTYTRDLDYTFLLIIVPLLVVLYFTFSTSMGRVEDSNRHLSQLNQLYMSTIETLAMAIDAKDQITHGHIRRVQTYAVGLAKALGVTEELQIRAIEAAALLHDMGKLAVPEYILNKPGPLTAAEFEKMKLHASVGADILSAIDFPYPVVPIVRHHHENWNGTGYPAGLKESEIPIGARILSVVDCFDALTSDRPYRPRLSNKEALRILHERRGSMYDPIIVDLFTRVHEEIAPQESAEAPQPSLRAITEAAIPAPEEPGPRHLALEEITASSDEMLTLFELARSLNANMRVQDATELIARHLRRLIPSISSVLYLYDEGSDELVAAHIAGEHSPLIRGMRIPVGQRLSGWVAANRQTIRNSDPVLDFGESARAMSPRPRSCLSTPLVAADSLIGVLSIYSANNNGFTEEHERIVEVIARQVSPIIGAARESHDQRVRALIDEKTGLPNLRHLGELIESRLGCDEPNAFTLLAIHLTQGQDSPTQAELIDATKRALRPADLLFSTGQTDLAVVLLNTDRSTGQRIARQIAGRLQSRSGIEVRVIAGQELLASAEGGFSIEDLLRRTKHPLDGRPPEAIH
jgi:putative nucleotidyltransferase with HDIG domain